MPPFFAPGISGAGPLAFGSRAAPAWSTLPPLPLAPPDVPLLAAGAPQAATKPRLPRSGLWSSAYVVAPLCLSRRFYREHLVTATRWGQRRLVGSNASRI